MTTPSGTITMADVNAEIGASPTANITLNDTAVRRLAATATLSPTSPFLTGSSQISLDNLRGRKATMFASGGNEVVDSDGHRIHIFTGPGTFTVNYVFPTANTVEYVVVAGGGGGGAPGFNGFTFKSWGGGGGGAGGFRTGTGYPVSTTPGSYSVSVGGGGVPGTNNAIGNDSSFDTITSNGGGGGGNPVTSFNGFNGGSGGGAAGPGTTPVGGTGNLPTPTTPPQGNPGGNSNTVGGGGGGAGGSGTAGGLTAPPPAPVVTGSGGNGTPVTWVPTNYGTASPIAPGRWFAGGGAGGTRPSPTTDIGGSAGAGGGGTINTSGTTNTGGGGGGGTGSPNGGSGIVIIRYPIA